MNVDCQKRKSINVYDYIAVLFMVIESGSVYFSMLHPGISRYSFVLYSIGYFYSKNKRLDFLNGGIFFLISTLIWIINFFFYLNEGITSYAYLNFILLNLASYLIISSIDFYAFKKVLLNIVFVLAIVSLIIFYLVEYRGYSCTKEKTYMHVYSMYMMHSMGWDYGLFGRLAGIFWEPGAYQIVLNLTILLHINELLQSSIFVNIKFLIKLLVILIASLFTMSTAGYFVLLSIGVVLLLNFSSIKKYKFLMPLSFFLCFCLYTYIMNSDAVVYKFDQEGLDGSSYEVRRADNLAMLAMISEHPIIGCGVDSDTYVSLSSLYGNTTASNGLLATASRYGLVLLFFYLFFYYKGIKRMRFNVNSFYIFIILLLLNSSEVFMHYPLMSIFLYSFNKSKDDETERNCISIC